jgi:hypothetical protein
LHVLKPGQKLTQYTARTVEIELRVIGCAMADARGVHVTGQMRHRDIAYTSRACNMGYFTPDLINVRSLAKCQVASDGSAICLKFEDADGRPVALGLPHACVQQLIMTLPHLLSKALLARYGDHSLRAVFPLSDWRLEFAAGSKNFILTMSTPDGFEVSFVVSPRNMEWMMSEIEERRSMAEKGGVILSS